MISYRASGIVLGNCWGGGICGYAAERFTANSRVELDQQINDGIKDGSLDSGMGFESIIGAAMDIETVDTRIIDSKTFIATDVEIQLYGVLTEEQVDFLLTVV